MVLVSRSTSDRSKTTEYIALVCSTLISFGDAVEMFLPGTSRDNAADKL